MKHTVLLIMLMFTHTAFSTDCSDYNLKMKDMLRILEKERVLDLSRSYRVIDDEESKRLFLSGEKRDDLNYCRPSVFKGLESCWKVSIHKNIVCSKLTHTSPKLPAFLGPAVKYLCRVY